MKTVDFKDGKFAVEERGITLSGVAPAVLTKEVLNETYERIIENSGTIETEKKEEIDCSEAIVKNLALPEGLKTCVGVDGTFHIKVEVKGWVSLDRQQAAKLAYTLANFVES